MNKAKDFKGKDVLFVDLETAYNLVPCWRPGKQFIGHEIIRERQIICACWKWAGEPTVYTSDFGLRKQDDTRVLKEITKVINSTKVVIGQNIDRFDLPWIQGRNCLRQLPPIKQKPLLMTLDTLKLSRGTLNLNSYKLDYLSKKFGLGGKIRMQFEDWTDILERKCPVAYAKMLKYCPKDVRDVEKIFYKLLPYVKLPQGLATILGGSRKGCPECGTMEFRVRGYVTELSGIQKIDCECKYCGRRYRGERRE